jgi:hypothetical protein
MKGKDKLKDTIVDGRIIYIKTDMTEKVCESMDWIQVPQDKAQCRTVVNKGMKLKEFHKKRAFSCPAL